MHPALHSVTASFPRREMDSTKHRISMRLFICKNNNQDPILSIDNVTAKTCIGLKAE